jgi:hypothetical protein
MPPAWVWSALEASKDFDQNLLDLLSFFLVTPELAWVFVPAMFKVITVMVRVGAVAIALFAEIGVLTHFERIVSNTAISVTVIGILFVASNLSMDYINISIKSIHPKLSNVFAHRRCYCICNIACDCADYRWPPIAWQ